MTTPKRCPSCGRLNLWSSLAAVYVGLVFLAGVLAFGLSNFGMKTILGILFCLVFVVVGGYLFRRSLFPLVFDRRSGLFMMGRRSPGAFSRKKGTSALTRLDDI